MKQDMIENIYNTLMGLLDEEYRVPGVENLFAEGSECMNSYGEMLAAYERLCARLGVVDEDADVEVIINSMRDIERNVSMKMFEYGMKFAQEKK